MVPSIMVGLFVGQVIARGVRTLGRIRGANSTRTSSGPILASSLAAPSLHINPGPKPYPTQRNPSSPTKKQKELDSDPPPPPAHAPAQHSLPAKPTANDRTTVLMVHHSLLPPSQAHLHHHAPTTPTSTPTSSSSSWMDAFSNLRQLHEAAARNDVAEIRSLVETHSLNVNDIIDSHLYTPLARAAAQGFNEAVALLLLLNADPHIQDATGSTPLHIAARRGHAEIVEQLLAYNADRTVRNVRPGHETRLCSSPCILDSTLFFGTDTLSRTRTDRQ